MSQRPSNELQSTNVVRWHHVSRGNHRDARRLLLKGLMVIAVLAVSLNASTCHAQGVINNEYALKGRLLAIVGDFFTWPDADKATPDMPFTIGIIGEDPFFYRGGNYLDDNVTRRNQRENRTIRVLRFDSAKDYQPCHVLYVAQFANPRSVERTLDARMAAMLKIVKGKSVLMVADSPGRAQQGATVNLDIRGNNVVLEVNPAEATRHNLKPSPAFLRAANIVPDPPPAAP